MTRTNFVRRIIQIGHCVEHLKDRFPNLSDIALVIPS